MKSYCTFFVVIFFVSVNQLYGQGISNAVSFMARIGIVQGENIVFGGLVITPSKDKTSESLTALLFGNTGVFTIQEYAEQDHIVGNLMFNAPITIALTPWKNIQLQQVRLYLGARRKELSAQISVFSENDSTLTYACDTNISELLVFNTIKINSLLPNLAPDRLSSASFNSLIIKIIDPFTKPTVEFEATIDFSQFNSIVALSFKKSLITLKGSYQQKKGLVLVAKELQETSILLPNLLSDITIYEVNISQSCDIKKACQFLLTGSIAIDFPGIADVVRCNITGTLIGNRIDLFKGTLNLIIDVIGFKYQPIFLQITPKMLPDFSCIEIIGIERVVGDVVSATLIQLTPILEDNAIKNIKEKLMNSINKQDISFIKAELFKELKPKFVVSFNQDISCQTYEDVKAWALNTGKKFKGTGNDFGKKSKNIGQKIKNAFTP